MTDAIDREQALVTLNGAIIGIDGGLFVPWEDVKERIAALPSVPTPDVSPVPPTAESEKLNVNALPEFVVPITRQIHANADDPTEAFLIQGLSSSTVQGDWVSRLQKLVDEQAEDEMLWFVTENITEAYLQQELRRLHAAIENRPALREERE